MGECLSKAAAFVRRPIKDVQNRPTHNKAIFIPTWYEEIQRFSERDVEPIRQKRSATGR
jgi:hypothetical protein